MPETLFIEMRKKINLNEINFSALDKLHGKTISLAAVIQYINFIIPVKKYLENKGMKVIIKKGRNYPAHIIGCDSSAFGKNADNFLLLSDGKFHALNNALELDREIYVFNGKNLEKISKEDIEKEKRKIKAKLSKFLSSDKIGILVSLKQGQKKPEPYIYDIIEKLKAKNKKPYVFESDTIYIGEIDNFPDIKVWINTACPGLALDSSKIINLQDIEEFL